MTMTPTTAAAMSAVAVDKAGVGSAVLNSSRQVGGSLGIAVMGAIVASGDVAAAGDTQRLAFLHGFHDALRVSSVLALAGAAVATLRSARSSTRSIRHRAARRGRMTATRPAADRRTSGGRRCSTPPATSSPRSSYRGATTAEIAREAGISEPILYRHFGSKRDLYLACLDEAWRSFREGAEQAIADDPIAASARSPTRTWRRTSGFASSTCGSRR